MTVIQKLLGVMLCMLLARPAAADWLEARSSHFVIEANTSEARLRDFATRLEHFDGALHTLYGVPDDPARKANPLLIIAVDRDTINRLAGSNFIAGFYKPRADRPVIFTGALNPPRQGPARIGSLIATSSSYDLDAQSTLLHEYSHHFMFNNFPRTYPLWFTEGFAEFNGNVAFQPDGSVAIGASPGYRQIGLNSGAKLSIDDLLDPPARVRRDAELVDLLYGRGWLLTHYLMVEGHKHAELIRYLDLVGAGKPSIAAATEAFGDLSKLSGDMDALLQSNKVNAIVIRPAAIAPITVTRLSFGANAMMPTYLQTMAGVAKDHAAAVARSAEDAAVPYAKDVFADDALAEAELDAQAYDRADAAVDRALAVSPPDIQAMLLKGRIAVQRLILAKSADPARWKAARSWFVQANHLTPDAAEPLLLYYASYVPEGGAIPEAAYRGLLRAQVLAPQEAAISLFLAEHDLRDAHADQARAVLQPLSSRPHQGEQSSATAKAIEAMDAGKAGDARAALYAAIAEHMNWTMPKDSH